MTNEERVELLIAEMKRCIEIMEDPKFHTRHSGTRLHSEIKAKMHEVRRDSIALEKILYPDFSHIHR